jgi:hypothetical protein
LAGLSHLVQSTTTLIGMQKNVPQLWSLTPHQ